MSDRGDDTAAAPASHGAPTGPLPGPRPPLSGWPQPPASTGYGGPPSHPTEALPRQTGAFGQPVSGFPPSASVTQASAPPYGTGFPPASTGGSPLGGPPPGRGSRPASRVLTFVGFGLTILLLLVVIGQAVLLAGLSNDLDDAQAAQTKAETSAAKDREDLSNLTKRVQGLEERTEGTLNSTAVAKKVLPSVFSVRAGQATGTAFAFGTDPNGGTLLITNYHVVDGLVTSGGKNATIQRDSESYPVTIERTDKNRDIAVLRASAKFTPLKPSESEVEPGDPVIVVGAPLGLTDTVTTGVVSAIRDDVEGLSTRVIQFDAAINPGNSGGPVINAEGEVVGIAQAKIIAEGADGLGLAIPINEACKGGLVSC